MERGVLNWHHLLLTVQHLTSDVRGGDLPDIMMVHSGGNDLGLIPGARLIKCK